MKIIKNIFLCLMVLICIVLSSQVWLQLPDFLSLSKNSNSVMEQDEEYVDIWNVVKPNKYILKTSTSQKEFYIDNESSFWISAVNSLEVSLKNFNESQSSLIVGEFYPKEYIMMEFKNKLPFDIFIGKLGISKDSIKTKLNYIDKIVFGLNENNSIYIYNGDSTIIIKNNKIDNKDIYEHLKDVNNEDYLEYSENIEVGGEIIPVPVPNISTALNPVFVQSELDVTDKASIEGIAKEYFKNSYDYVRRSEEIEGDILFVYKNEKVLKISSEGLLDFFDSKISLDNSSNMYESLETALRFAMNFLTFPEDMYLSSVNVAQYDGNFGYKFIFTYRILNKPILFSKVRDTAALEVEVIGDNVVSYQRLIRNIDTNPDNEVKKEMKEREILSLKEVLDIQLKITNDSTDINALKVIYKSMISEIDNVYLAYFDRARKIKEQQLIVVWVVEINEKTYIFNAITGAIMEEPW